MYRKCQNIAYKSVPDGAAVNHYGMTALELMIVIAILGILTGIAASAYSSYRVSEYDAEAIATLNELYAQSTQAMAEWGVGDNGIASGCRAAVNCNGDAGGSEGIFCSANEDARFANTMISLPQGVHHWRYQLCFGHIDADNDVEGFLISAHRRTGNGNEERTIVYGTGIETPIIEADTTDRDQNLIIPEGAQLVESWSPQFL